VSARTGDAAAPAHTARLIDAIRAGDLGAVKALLAAGASADAVDEGSGLTALMVAAGRGDAKLTRMLVEAGADPRAVDRGAGASVLHKACQGGSVEVVRCLVEAGAFVDAVTPTTGHTPLMDALWFKWPAIVQYLLDQGAGLNLSTHYGFSLAQHVEFELHVNIVGKERFLEAERLVRRRRESDEAQVRDQRLMAAVTHGDTEAVKALLDGGAPVDERFPRVNGFNDAHTPLLVAARDGHTPIVAELLRAHADVNAVEPVFGATPLHKAVYNGHADITRLLVEHPSIDLNVQGATNGYTPLHDALWHGYADCADLIIAAGARLNLLGHDSKTPLDLAIEVLGPNHPTVGLITDRLGPPGVRRQPKPGGSARA
jgi:ankyrin repeat protein